MTATTIVLLSDSTNAWFVDTADRDSTMVAALYDHFKITVKTSECSTLTGAYQALETTKPGIGVDEILMYDGSVGGSNWDDYTPTAIAARVTDVSPDIVLIAYGINGGESGATGIGAFIDDVQAAAPSAEIIMLSQNPITSHGATDTNRDLIQAAAAAESLTFVDVYQAFIDTGDYASYLADGAHPNAAGNRLYVDTALAPLAAAIPLSPQEVPMPILDTAALVLRANRYSGSGALLDESGNSFHGTIGNAPTFDGEKFVMVAASSHYIVVSDQPELDPGSGSFTIVFVTNPRAGGNGRVLSKRANGVAWWSIDYASGDSKFIWGVSDNTNTKTQDTAAFGAATAGGGPYVVSVRHDASDGSGRMGMDGSYTDYTSSVGAVSSATDLSVNTWADVGQYGEQDFYGLVVYSGAYLSDAEVEAAGEALVALGTPGLMLMGAG